MSSPIPTREQVLTALAGVNDPEIGRPITELGMVKSIEIGDDGLVAVGVYLTVSGCPMRDTITSRVTGAVTPLSGVTGVRVELDVMNEDQRKELQPSRRLGLEAPGIAERVEGVRQGESVPFETAPQADRVPRRHHLTPSFQSRPRDGTAAARPSGHVDRAMEGLEATRPGL